MFDLKKRDLMLRNCPRDAYESYPAERQFDVDSEFGDLQGNANTTGEDFMSLRYSSCRKNGEMTVETARMINSEIASQVLRKLDEMTTVLISLNIQPINSAFAEKVLPTLQNSLNMLENGFSTKVELCSNV